MATKQMATDANHSQQYHSHQTQRTNWKKVYVAHDTIKGPFYYTKRHVHHHTSTQHYENVTSNCRDNRPPFLLLTTHLGNQTSKHVLNVLSFRVMFSFLCAASKTIIINSVNQMRIFQVLDRLVSEMENKSRKAWMRVIGSAMQEVCDFSIIYSSK